MSGQWMIYGANGYTGRLAARLAKDRHLSPVLAGRHAEHIRPLAHELGFESRVFDLTDPAVAATNLEGIAAVLHCAGPFSATSRPMLAACLRAKTALSRYHWRDRGIRGYPLAQPGVQKRRHRGRARRRVRRRPHRLPRGDAETRAPVGDASQARVQSA